MKNNVKKDDFISRKLAVLNTRQGAAAEKAMNRIIANNVSKGEK